MIRTRGLRWYLSRVDDGHTAVGTLTTIAIYNAVLGQQSLAVAGADIFTAFGNDDVKLHPEPFLSPVKRNVVDRCGHQLRRVGD